MNWNLKINYENLDNIQWTNNCDILYRRTCPIFSVHIFTFLVWSRQRRDDAKSTPIPPFGRIGSASKLQRYIS